MGKNLTYVVNGVVGTMVLDDFFDRVMKPRMEQLADSVLAELVISGSRREIFQKLNGMTNQQVREMVRFELKGSNRCTVMRRLRQRLSAMHDTHPVGCITIEELKNGRS